MIILIINSNNFFLTMINVLTLQGENCCCSLLGPNTLYDNSQLTIMLKKCQGTIACYLNRPMMILNSYNYFPVLG